MSELAHEGTIDSSTDHYEITGIDRATRKVLVNFAYQGHGLHHSVFVENVEDAEGILVAVQLHYEQYQRDVEKAHARRLPLPDTVVALLGYKHVMSGEI